jgi:hypothetical protein
LIKDVLLLKSFKHYTWHPTFALMRCAQPHQHPMTNGSKSNTKSALQAIISGSVRTPKKMEVKFVDYADIYVGKKYPCSRPPTV